MTVCESRKSLLSLCLCVYVFFFFPEVCRFSSLLKRELKNLSREEKFNEKKSKIVFSIYFCVMLVFIVLKTQ